MYNQNYSAETIIETKDKRYKISLSLGVAMRDNVKDFLWSIVIYQQDPNESIWSISMNDCLDNFEFIITRLKTKIMMNIENSFNRDFREFKEVMFG